MQSARPKRFPIFGFRRGGSSIFFQLIQHLCNHDNIASQDLVGEYDAKGVDIFEIKSKPLHAAFKNNTFVGVFRAFPHIFEKLNESFDLRPIFIVRDPIDCALSWYHARYLHKPKGDNKHEVWSHVECSLSEYIEQHDDFHHQAIDLVDRLKAYPCLYVRYEDLITSPIKVIHNIIEHTGVVFSRRALDIYTVQANFLNLTQDEKSHNRSGMSGSLLSQCTMEDFSILYGRYAKLIRKFGYGTNYDIMGSRELPWDRLEIDGIKRVCMMLLEGNHSRLVETEQMLRDIAVLKEQNGHRIQEIFALQELLAASRPSGPTPKSDSLDLVSGTRSLAYRPRRVPPKSRAKRRLRQ